MDNLDLKAIGQRIKKRRKKLKFTQEQLAEGIGVSSHYIYEIEAGNKQVVLNKFKGICDFLNTDMNFLIEGKDSQYPTTPHQQIKETNTYGTSYQYKDLDSLTNNLSDEKKAELAEIISVILKHMN